MHSIVYERPHLKSFFELVDRKGMDCVWAGQPRHETFIIFEKDERGESMNYRCFRGKQAEAEIYLHNIEDACPGPSTPAQQQAP